MHTSSIRNYICDNNILYEIYSSSYCNYYYYKFSVVLVHMVDIYYNIVNTTINYINSNYDLHFFHEILSTLILVIIIYSICIFICTELVFIIFKLVFYLTKKFRKPYNNSIDAIIESTNEVSINDRNNVVYSYKNGYKNNYDSEDINKEKDIVEDQDDYLLIRLKNINSTKSKRYVTRNPINTRSKKQKYN